jgi:hypothetical protein
MMVLKVTRMSCCPETTPVVRGLSAVLPGQPWLTLIMINDNEIVNVDVNAVVSVFDLCTVTNDKGG